MVGSKEYFYYLRRAFFFNRMCGYRLNRKVNNRTCIYFEDGKWVVAYVKKGIAIDSKLYDENNLWNACEDITKRLAQNDNHYKKIWMDWASPVNWAKKMDEPIGIRVVTNEDIDKSKGE